MGVSFKFNFLPEYLDQVIPHFSGIKNEEVEQKHFLCVHALFQISTPCIYNLLKVILDHGKISI